MATILGKDNKTYTLGSSEYTDYLLGSAPGAATQATAPITFDTLNTTVQPLTLQPTIPSTEPQGLEAYIGSVLGSYRTERDAEITELQNTQKTGQSTIASIYEKLVGQSARSEEIYKQEGVDMARKEVDTLTSQIEAEQLASRRQVEDLERRNPSGLFGGALQDEADRINRLSLQKQADLAIIQSAALRKYDTASAIADRKIQLEMEPLKVQLDALKFFYSENQSQLTKKEDQKFQDLITQDERAYNEKLQATKSLQDTKLQLLQSAASQGAPVSIQQAIQQATTPEEAIQAAGQYAGDILDRQYKQFQIANIQSQIAERASQEVALKPPTQAEQLASGFAQRVSQANEVIDLVGSKFTGTASYFGSLLPNRLKSSERQKFEQAQSNFINAVLRRESGAAISEGEFKSARTQYFPQPGDTPEVLEQKRQNRLIIQQNLEATAGNALPLSIKSDDPLGLF